MHLFLNYFSTRLIFTFLLVGCLMGCGHCPMTAKQNLSDPANLPEKSSLRLTILFFNDLHGYLTPFPVKENSQSVETGGIARIAHLIQKIEAENTEQHVPTFVLFAGDMLQGTPMSTEFKGEPDMHCFNFIGVDAMTSGNHEFDFGMENFLHLQSMATFPILSSNIQIKSTDQLLCEPFHVLPVSDGINLTVIGVTTSQLMVTTKPSNVEDLTILDPVESVMKTYHNMHANGPVIVLSHCEARTDEEIARRLPGLTAIIGGHDQILLNPRKLIGNVPIFQAFEKGRYLGRCDVVIDPTTKDSHVTNWTYYPITADILDDPEIHEMVHSFSSRLDAIFKVEIGTAQDYLNGDREHIRYEETTLGNFVTDVMREYTGASIALLNSGSLRASIDEGPVTIEEVFQVMPYANELLRSEISGDILQEVLKRSVRGTRADEDGGFLQVSGITFTIKNHEVFDIRINGDPLDPDSRYQVAITDFMAEGGDGYSMLKDRPVIKTGLPLRELLVDTIRMRKEIIATPINRITRIN